MINSRDPNELLPFVKQLHAEFTAELDRRGIQHVTSATYRDHEYQNYLYAQGRTRPGKRVTWVRGGDSFHQWRVVFDILLLDGKNVLADEDPLWNEVGQLGAEQFGLTWGISGPAHDRKDKPHFQYDAGLSIADFKAGWSIDETGAAVEPTEA